MLNLSPAKTSVLASCGDRILKSIVDFGSPQLPRFSTLSSYSPLTDLLYDVTSKFSSVEASTFILILAFKPLPESSSEYLTPSYKGAMRYESKPLSMAKTILTQLPVSFFNTYPSAYAPLLSADSASLALNAPKYLMSKETFIAATFFTGIGADGTGTSAGGIV
ncbi:hypothetical protein MNB_SUP05-SYMBIONT-4-418 [hydrothermal vent metagenome]|uniref:Uncharacterized protein n=1 Tax=hydrothermal vent metagenome TaxID=652676 RepID=A0A1W1E036_9ZZZZ